MTQHYKFSPSASQRQMACPASAHLPAVEQPESVYMAEGTAAHSVAECLLRSQLGDPADPPPEFADSTRLSPEMLAAAKVFVDYCAPLAKLEACHAYGLEETMQSGRLDGYGGTVDFFAAHDTHLTVVDFKYGAGYAVAAERNTQLLDYAALLTESYPYLQTYTLAIVQPRTPGDAIDEWHCFREDVDRHFAARQAAAGRNDYHAGDHCRWCPHRMTCDAQYEAALEVARETFDDLAPTDKLGRLAELYLKASQIKSYLEAIPATLLGAMQKGQTFPGVKAVKAIGHRAWTLGEDETVKALTRRKLGKRIVYDAKLKSPSQLEREGYGAEIADLVSRRDNGFTVVAAGDKRPAVVFETAEDLFSDFKQDLSFLD